MEQRKRLASGDSAGIQRNPQAPSFKNTSSSPSSSSNASRAQSHSLHSENSQLHGNTLTSQPSHSHQQQQDLATPSDHRTNIASTGQSTRPSEPWTPPMPHAREPTMGFYHPAPTPGLGGHATQSMSAAPGIWSDSYTTMAGNPYWYEPGAANNSSSNTNNDSVTPSQEMSVDGHSDGMDHLDMDHQNVGAYHDQSYTTSSSGIFLGGMEWSNGAVAPGINPEMQRRITHQSGMAPADSNLFSEFTLSSNGPTPVGSQSYVRGLAPQLDERWQRRGSSGTISVTSDQPRRGQSSRSSRRASVAQDGKIKREHAQKGHRGTTSPQRGGRDASRPTDRTTHNDVERKYRMNLKDKIAELRAAIPALQTGSEGEGSDPGTGATGNPKVSKGTVLSKATEYIRELEEMNRNMATEHHHLVQRLHELETLLQENSTGRARAAPPFQQNQVLGNFDSTASFD